MEAHTTYPKPPASSARRFSAAEAGEQIRASLERLLERLGPEAVFGTPVRHGDVLVVPVAEVRVGSGFGAGSGPAEGDAAEAPEGAAVSAGGGGGLGGRIVPRGFIRLARGNAHFVPAVDATRLVLGSLALGALSVLVLGRALVRPDAPARSDGPTRARFWRRS